MDDPLPPSYEASSAATTTEGVGQLIDLGTDITAPPSDPQGSTADDIVAQLAQLGVSTSTAVASSNGTAPTIPQQTSTSAAADEFDMFAESRTAYGTQQQGYVGKVPLDRGNLPRDFPKGISPNVRC